MLRDLHVDDQLIYRGLGFRVRDRDWNTVPATVEGLNLDETADGKSVLRLALAFRGLGLQVDCSLEAVMQQDALHVEAVARVRASGWFNRIGLVLLHPMPECTGLPCRITHCDGTQSEGTFPNAVAPPPLFRSLRTIAHRVAPGLWCECTLGGEDFETEDQRLFSDASLKTYARANGLPRPVHHSVGKRIRQSLSISWTGAARAPIAGAERAEPDVRQGEAQPPAILRIAAHPTGRMPPIGILLAPPSPSIHARDIATSIRDSRAAFVLCRIDETLDESGWRTTAAIVRMCGKPLVLEISTLKDGTASLIERCSAVFRNIPIESVRLALPCAPDLVGLIRSRFEGIPVGISAQKGLIEFHRNQLLPAADFVAFATSAIIHDADTQAIMETTRSLPAMLRTARAIAKRPVHLGPSAIGTLQHPHQPVPLPNPSRANLPMAAYSPRMDETFAGAWTVALLADSAGMTDSVCLFATHGPNGIIDGFGNARPLCSVFTRLCESAGHVLRTCENSNPHRLAALAAEAHDSVNLFLANRTGEPLAIRLPEIARSGDICVLPEEADGTSDSNTRTVNELIELDGYAVRCLRCSP